MSAAGSRTSVLDAPTVRASGRPGASRSRRWAVAAVAAVALLPLAGCAAGVRAETSRERPTVDGIGGAIGTLTIRNAYIGGPAEVGGSAPLLLSVFNGGTEPDRLVSVSAPDAGSVTLPADTTLAPGGQQLFYTADRTPRLTGLTSRVRLGEIVPVVLAFERAGELRMTLPVSPAPTGLLAAPSSAGATPSATATPAVPSAPSQGTPASPSASPSASIAP
ncbi:MAG TPA: hypothetical protein VLR26_06600 [Frankiaceae bacterium]|nr:hypothetical protein [Frankiaceae bacterium]